MLDIIGTIIFGAIIGALARLFMRGNQNIGMLWTIILGVLGAIVGQFLANLLGVGDTDGIDWLRWIISIICSIIFISIYLAVTRGRNRDVRR
jgi:uncharacterized membrane protein YeaQ/YmgE (transglycosylase-associated protein family)